MVFAFDSSNIIIKRMLCTFYFLLFRFLVFHFLFLLLSAKKHLRIKCYLIHKTNLFLSVALINAETVF